MFSSRSSNGQRRVSASSPCVTAAGTGGSPAVSSRACSADIRSTGTSTPPSPASDGTRVVTRRAHRPVTANGLSCCG
ncbi:hypothetical protein KZZ52_34525 [Dactylosporangium sp. AC04546]|uniref:hypothetical protein n=1 Tax=Dactylosporangium sp. AC04546 TaxID=2862460 RepID=UPI001EE0E5AA|nr:hypothetical protein [Dactylosporangium sp. AC04546]WVK79088.1 hypothetical protein KZZ52_34525 [Dactylosporangium sp. AC04546]